MSRGSAAPQRAGVRTDTPRRLMMHVGTGHAPAAQR